MSLPLKPIPFDPFRMSGPMTADLMEKGTKATRLEHDYLKSQMENAVVALPDVAEGLVLRMRSKGGMAYVTFSCGVMGSGRIASGIDALTGRSVFQVRGTKMARPVAASVLGTVRRSVLGLERPLRIITRPTGPAAFDPSLYRPNHLMAFRPRGGGRTDAARNSVVDVSTCWVGSEALDGLLRSLVTGVEVGREAVDRTMSLGAVHAYADDSVCPGY
jgi:hypothetical protein